MALKKAKSPMAKNPVRWKDEILISGGGLGGGGSVRYWPPFLFCLQIIKFIQIADFRLLFGIIYRYDLLVLRPLS